VPLKAAFFDVGDTLVEHWAPPEIVGQKARAQVCAVLGERPWLDRWIQGEIEPAEVKARPFGGWPFDEEWARQPTLEWYERWFTSQGIDLEGIDLETLRAAMCIPLDEISIPVPGAFEALRWCKHRGLRVVIVSNTLSRGDREILEDWRRFGVSDVVDGVVSSHSVGWRKPHEAIFRRALEIARAQPEEAFHVGDSLIADVWGAKRLGIRAVWRRVERQQPDVGVLPDATVDDLTELQAAVSPWLARRVA
jgi:FMN phosphatase YigB (HAD superfamily)